MRFFFPQEKVLNHYLLIILTIKSNCDGDKKKKKKAFRWMCCFSSWTEAATSSMAAEELPKLGQISPHRRRWKKKGGGVRFKFSLLTWHSLPPLREERRASKRNPISPHPPQSEFGIKSKTLSAVAAAAVAGKRTLPGKPSKSSVNDTVSGRLGSAADGRRRKNKYEKGLRLGRGGTVCAGRMGETSSKQLSHVLGVEG